MKAYTTALVSFVFAISAAAQSHLDIMAPALKDTDLHGPIKSVDEKVSVNVSGDFEREHSEYDRTGNLLSDTEWSADGKLANTLTNFYDDNGNFNRQLYMDIEDEYTNDWQVVLSPDTHQIAMKKKLSKAAAIYTYSDAGYLISYRYLNKERELKSGSITKRDENNRRKEFTRLDGDKKPLYTYWFKWKENGLIDRERQKYRQEDGERLHIYDYLKFDDHGNWTQRLMVRYDVGGKEKKKVYERLVVRDLEYFDDETTTAGGLEVVDVPDAADTNAVAEAGGTSHVITAPDKTEPKPVAEMLATGRSQEELKELFGYTFDDIADKLVIINCSGPDGRSAGSGFIAKMDGKTYLFTNQHVIMGADTIRLRTAAGEELRPKGIELSAKRDIARMPLDDRPAFEISTRFAQGSALGVFGNSEGAGVATELFGEVTGLGADLVEVNAEFVSGNSGSPVLNTKQEVIGIASFVRVTWTPPKKDEKKDKEKSDDEDKKKGDDDEDNKPKVKTRRFCYRLDDLKWMPVRWRDYNKKYGNLYRNSESISTTVFDIISTWSDAPVEMIDERDDMARDLSDWIKRHNEIITHLRHRKYTKSSFLNAYSQSLEALAKTCRDRSRRVAMFSKQRELSGFLRKEFEKTAYSLDYAGWYIELIGRKIENQ